VSGTNSVPTVAQALVPLSHYCRRQTGPGYMSLALLAMLLHRRRYGSDGAVWSTDLLPATWAQTPGCIDRDHEAKQVRLWTGAEPDRRRCCPTSGVRGCAGSGGRCTARRSRAVIAR
jgi:hypothetical protein